MTHLENISQLFSRSFVESPLVESFEAGTLTLTSGKLVVSDPLLTAEMPAFTQGFPSGSFTVNIHREKESHCIAYTEIVFGHEAITLWELALKSGENLSQLKGEEIFGFPVESGMGCCMDLETQQALNRLEVELHQLKGDDFMGLYEEFFHAHFFDERGAIDQFAFLRPQEDFAGNLLAFETGYGEGFYASYIGYSATGEPQKLVTEFIELMG